MKKLIFVLPLAIALINCVGNPPTGLLHEDPIIDALMKEGYTCIKYNGYCAGKYTNENDVYGFEGYNMDSVYVWGCIKQFSSDSFRITFPRHTMDVAENNPKIYSWKNLYPKEQLP